MIAQDLAEAIAARVAAAGTSETTLSELRQTYPDMHFTYCMDDDIQSEIEPFLSRPGFNIYLVDGRDHCLKLTKNAEQATGLVLAEVVEDD